MQQIIIYMVVRNVSSREKLFSQVVEQASKISKDFFIVDHGSDDTTKDIIQALQNTYELHLEYQKEVFEGTMDDMKGKYYQVLKKKYAQERVFILILDWDEVLDEILVSQIQHLDFQKDIYFLNRHTYFIKKSIDARSYLPLLFEVKSVEVAPFETFHKLYKLHSSRTQKLKGVLHHYSYTSLADLFKKNVYYATHEAAALYKEKNNIGNIRIFFSCIFEGTLYFLYSLLYHFNFLHLEGWLYSMNWYVYKFYKYSLYLELRETGKIS